MLLICILLECNRYNAIVELLQFGGNEAEKPRVDSFTPADRSYEMDQKAASSRDGSVANGIGLNANNLRYVCNSDLECIHR